ncbi:hypothetical protein GCM10009744_57320 [Kribbella alba]|uniref:Uncharacterized protein n=1 Tax=Kribbella alba TaxID=190197 RepID=A0ABN2FR05_9ACTN
MRRRPKPQPGKVEEETGWRPGPLSELIYSQPGSGIIDSAHHVFRAHTATYLGVPVEQNESGRIQQALLEG